MKAGVSIPKLNVHTEDVRALPGRAGSIKNRVGFIMNL
jgi:hypothetical protein